MMPLDIGLSVIGGKCVEDRATASDSLRAV
jgi:hypothetical protein